MDEKQKYFEIWQNAVANAAEAMKSCDLATAEKYEQQMEDAFERYREACNYESNTMNSDFIALNTTLESVMPKLMAKDKKALKESIKLENISLVDLTPNKEYIFPKRVSTFRIFG